MNQLWPRLGPAAARIEYERLLASGGETLPAVASQHPQQTFAATGGVRVSKDAVAALAEVIEAIASEYGYPEVVPATMRTAFDKKAAAAIFAEMRVTSFEASQPDVWSFLSLVAMPHVTRWRFGIRNPERWIASDLTRHMFSRLWWQAFTFGVDTGGGGIDLSLLGRLKESDLNQLTERKSIGGNHRLARIVADELTRDGSSRRAVLRDFAPKLLARTPFIDFAVLSDDELRRLVRTLLDED